MRENMAFGLLNLSNFTYDDVFQFHLPANDKILFFFVAE
jgi:hypothetical protein